ncbi:Synaptojanin, N-terminal [Cynara cardunculus var. scolymus]|uniref:Synaptojanin, N-terminal n=1 Tax=Cynara cardunculus var. scolymus TaxID=59895 RepID=A0A103YGL5_CYNCS|nr:Synaptojanin, N-terminal [Cynara cardunculus var. scolymus]
MMVKALPSQKLYTRMRLWEFPDQYIVEPTDGSSGSCLAVSRVNGSMTLVDEVPRFTTPRVPKIQTVFGVIGMLKLLAGSYLLVITERESVGTYLGHPIFKVLTLKVFPCDHSLKNSPEEQKRMESEFSNLLKVAEKTTGLYFSYDVNITLRVQRLNELGDESKLLPLWRQAEPRFLWNNYMLEVFIDNKVCLFSRFRAPLYLLDSHVNNNSLCLQLDPYMLPVIQGSFQSFQSAIGLDIIDVTLIARRCTRRTGTRLWRRGADSDGYVANFVESEQIIQLKGFIASFVQVRGSMPFLWEQIVDLTYKPKFDILRPEEAPRVAERHFLDLRKKYGNVLAVDLVNTHGGEGRLTEQFATSVQDILNDDVRYLHFDFHHICGHVHFERLSILYEQIEDFLIKNRYYLLNEKGEKVEAQVGIVRTNCVDCLDRTNVTQVYLLFYPFNAMLLAQSMIGRKMLEFQLQRLGVFDAEETISAHPNIDDCFKILWANHGDDISIQYSGTPALKGDFVRFGKRTLQGILKDGWNALMRYYLNNFVDGTKQSLPLALALITTGLFFTMVSLTRVRNDLWQLLFSILWGGLSIGIAIFVRANGRVFCNRPRLHKPPR